ncbi:2OG-Fe(II) oxygenase [Luteimonas sp. Y-2-2-4F]|nr:2OG-Fe(II) oxygenase [Luteimonas sp. Y-2-2-4F]MCD9033019.1 2OG-Fe(II) oxygenase [Luteimonas sp. Y-2-2-4F]
MRTAAPAGDPRADAALERPGDAIVVVDGFLSPVECRSLLDEQARGEWVDSVVANAVGGAMHGGGRHSDSLVLPGYGATAARLLCGIEQRLQAAFGVAPSHLEPWQMTRYRRGGVYDYHVDCGVPHPSGERERTILIVLEPPVRGGATHFRALRRTVRPLAGRLVVWRNLLPSGRCNHAMVHSGRPVWQGTKTILTTWEHPRPYRDA